MKGKINMSNQNVLKIYVDTESENYELYDPYKEWQLYVASELAEKCVIYGNREYNDMQEAEWFERAKNILKDIDSYLEESDVCEKYNLSKEQFEAINELYDKCNVLEEIFLDTIKILYPEEKFVQSTIKGTCQREWQIVIYKEGMLEQNILEDFYWGNVASVYNEEKCIVEYIPMSKWPSKESDWELIARDVFDIPGEQEVQVLLSDGWIQQKKWKEIA